MDRTGGVLFAGGGTGGHLFPGVAVARELRRRRPEIPVVFAGSGRPVEQQVLGREGLPLERVRAVGLVGRSGLALLRGIATLPGAALDARRLLRRHRPRVVVGLGGYSSGPIVLLAALRRVPTLLLEQNAVPGFTNRVLARVARAAAVSYEVSRAAFGAIGFVTGNPVRPGFFAAGPPRDTLDRAVVLVLGGSQGAHAINVAMAGAAPRLAAATPPVQVVHQSGEADEEMVSRAYREAGLDGRVTPFIDDMEATLAAADLVVCRAGATTLAEVAASGRPAVLVPYPHATHDHQRKNAAVLAEAGAAEVIDPSVLDAEGLAERVLALTRDDARRGELARAVTGFATPEAAGRIVDRMERWLDGDTD